MADDEWTDEDRRRGYRMVKDPTWPVPVFKGYTKGAYKKFFDTFKGYECWRCGETFLEKKNLHKHAASKECKLEEEKKIQPEQLKLF